MKNKSIIFAASSAKTSFLNIACVVFFIATNTAVNAAIIGYHSNGYCATSSVIVFAETGKGSLSSFKYFNFSFMAKTMKDYSGAKHSNANVTPNSAKTVSIKAFNIEMNAKNKAYYFILSHGLLNQFSDFCKSYHSSNSHSDYINYLLSKN